MNLIGNGPEVLRKVTMLGNDFELSRRDLDLRQGRAVGAGRRRHADGEDRRDHRRRDQDAMTASGGGGRRVPDPKACQRLAEQMLALARKAGADGAEVLVRDGTELEVKVRLGETGADQGGGQPGAGPARAQGRARGGDLHVGSRRPRRWSGWRATPSSWRRWRSRIRSPALPAPEEMARDVPELDLWDDGVLSLDVAEGIRRARAGEAAALAFDKRVTNSDGAVFGRTVGASAFATSAGFSGSVRGTHVSLVGRAALRRRRRQEAQRLLLDRVALRCAGSRTPRRSASRRRGARSPSWARARSRPARRRWSSRPRRRAGCSASSPA